MLASDLLLYLTCFYIINITNKTHIIFKNNIYEILVMTHLYKLDQSIVVRKSFFCDKIQRTKNKVA